MKQLFYLGLFLSGIFLLRCDGSKLCYISCEDSLRPFSISWKSDIEARFPTVIVKFRYGNAAFLCQQAKLGVPTDLLILPEPNWIAKFGIRNQVVLLDSTAIGIVCPAKPSTNSFFLLPTHDQSLALSIQNNRLTAQQRNTFYVNTGDIIPQSLRKGVGKCAYLYEFQADIYQMPFQRITAKTTPIAMIIFRENPEIQDFLVSLAEKKRLFTAP